MSQLMSAASDTETRSTDQRIRRATIRINEMVGGTALQLALAIGRVVIEELYGGDLGAWRERGPKEHTLRQLVLHPSLEISASSLYRAIAMYELKVRIGNHRMWDVLTTCHIRTVLGLPEQEQRRLLELAVREELTTLALEGAAGEVRRQSKASRGGRPRKPRFARSIEHAEKALADESTVFGDLDALESMTPSERDELERRLSFVHQRCDELAVLIRESHRC
jgi:hypothetical protein